MEQEAVKSNKHRETSNDVNATERFEMNNRRHVPQNYVIKTDIFGVHTAYICLFEPYTYILTSCRNTHLY